MEADGLIPASDGRASIRGVLEQDRAWSVYARIAVTAGQGKLVLVIPDPLHVQMRNAPPEFTCGPQTPRKVSVEYATSDAAQDAAGVVRGIEFR